MRASQAHSERGVKFESLAYHNTSAESDLRKRVLKVLPQIFDMFNTNAESHEGIADAKLCSRRFWNARVRHDGWVLDKTLDSTETFSEREKMHGFEESSTLCDAALEEDRDHAAECGRAIKAHLF